MKNKNHNKLMEKQLTKLSILNTQSKKCFTGIRLTKLETSPDNILLLIPNKYFILDLKMNFIQPHALNIIVLESLKNSYVLFSQKH